MRIALRTVVAIIQAGAAAALLGAGNATTPREVSTPYPTITNLAIEWKIDGDDNENGRVEVEYRRVGERTWRRAMPLRRVPAGESVGTRPIFKWGNRHSGSIFDLRPDTEYEIRLKLSDPDGGAAEKVVRARTRPVPRAAAHARILRATPETLASLADEARPGDVLELAAGGYAPLVVKRDGAPGKPIVFRSRFGRLRAGTETAALRAPPRRSGRRDRLEEEPREVKRQRRRAL